MSILIPLGSDEITLDTVTNNIFTLARTLRPASTVANLYHTYVMVKNFFILSETYPGSGTLTLCVAYISIVHYLKIMEL